MSLFEARIKAAPIERRASARFVIDIPVVLRTVSGNRECRMANISDSSAKLETACPPREGVAGWLVLGSQEIYCKVIWTSAGACGIAFERALDEIRLAEIAGDDAARKGPVANADNIRMGRKRSGLIITGND